MMRLRRVWSKRMAESAALKAEVTRAIEALHTQ
jgi:hypothetical protein